MIVNTRSDTRVALDPHDSGNSAPASKPNPKPRLLMIIPAYNEEACIWHVVTSARQALPQADVLVVDDGSADETAGHAQLAGATVVRLPVNLGIGGAVQTGLKFAREMQYDVVVRIDADGQHNPELLADLLAPVCAGKADVTVGSRFLLPGDRMKVPALRGLGIRLFASEVSWLTGKKATDTTSGMCVMNAKAIGLLARFMPQDYPEVESRITLHAAGLRVLEVPVKMRERLAGMSSINTWRSIYYAFKVSAAVLMTGLKQTPRAVEWTGEGRKHGNFAMAHGRDHQPWALVGDSSAGSQEEVA